MTEEKKLTGYPSIDKPWLKYYKKGSPNTPSPDMSMYNFLYENNKENLDYTALDYYGKKISYRALLENIDNTATSLYAYGIRKGNIVSLCALNTPEFIYLLYALNKIGAICNWVGLTSPVEDLHMQLKSTDTKVVFTISIAYEQISKAANDTKVEKIIYVPIEYSMPALLQIAVRLKTKRPKCDLVQWQEFIKKKGTRVPTADTSPEDMAVIEYTGGSTGIPKGVMLSNKSVNSYYTNFAGINYNRITNYQKGEKYLSGVPLFLAFGLTTCCHGPLCHSLELVLSPDPTPKAGTKIILKSKVNHIVSGRLMIEDLVEKAHKTHADLSFVQSIMYGGEETNKVWENTVTERLRKHNLHVPVLNGYGMTETSAAILVAPDNETNGLIPFANVNVKVVDPEDSSKEYGYNTEGELCLSADTIMNGYYKNEDETNAVIFVENGIRWLKTHDLATISPDGIIKITGRIKRIYSRLTLDKIQIRVYPMRIEETLIKCELVHACAVIGVKDDLLAYRSVAYIILSEKVTDKENMRKQLEAYCRENLPDSHWPDEYVFLEEFPITRAGKVNYRALEEMANENSR